MMLTSMISNKINTGLGPFILSFAAVVLLIASSRIIINIPITETGIPITGQSFAVILIICLLDKKYNWIPILIYLLLGILGFGVFSDGASGFNQILGKSGGYLYGFLICAFLMNAFHNGMKQSSSGRLSFLILSSFYILLSGMLHLSSFIGLANAFNYGVVPFLTGAVIKLLAAFAIIEFLYFLSDKFSSRKR